MSNDNPSPEPENKMVGQKPPKGGVPPLSELHEMVENIKRRESKLVEKSVVLRNKNEDLSVRVDRLEKKFSLFEERAAADRTNISKPFGVALFALIIALMSILQSLF